MRRYDVTDQAVLAATPAEIVAALADEAAGRSGWWRPWVAMRTEGSVPYPQVGCRLTMRASHSGHLDRPWSRIGFSGEITVFEPDRRILFVFAKGDIHGSSEWRLLSVDSGHTRAAYRWVGEPAGLMRLAARFLDAESAHSALVHKAFAGIEAYVAAHRPGAV